jgi:hypothetical protein
MYSSTPSLTSALDGVGGQRHASAPLPPGKPGTLCIKAGWGSGRVRTDAENLSPPGFDSRTAQTVASRYTD